MPRHVKAEHQKLLETLRDARELLTRTGNNFALSSWEDATAALGEIDHLLSNIESGDLPKRSEIEPLFMASGPIQRVSVPSGWSKEYIVLANRFDIAIRKAYKVSSLLGDELEKDASLWRQWQEDGVTENTPLSVDFFFYTTDKTAAQDLADALRQGGLSQVKVSATRRLWVSKGWAISAIEQGTWSLEKLQNRSKAFCDLAAKHRVRYDGCGAMMPSNHAVKPE
jgi:hypothetical protein